MYLTPRFAGFQAGFSYTPENGSEAQDVVTVKNSGRYSDFLEFGINYTGDFSGVTVAASATGTSGNGRGHRAVPPALKDFTAWQVGAQVGYAGFKFGGGYVDAGNFNVPGGPTAVTSMPGTSAQLHDWPGCRRRHLYGRRRLQGRPAFGTGTYAEFLRSLWPQRRLHRSPGHDPTVRSDVPQRRSGAQTQSPLPPPRSTATATFR